MKKKWVRIGSFSNSGNRSLFRLKPSSNFNVKDYVIAAVLASVKVQ